jgi:CDP-diglyceride synthetase
MSEKLKASGLPVIKPEASSSLRTRRWSARTARSVPASPSGWDTAVLLTSIIVGAAIGAVFFKERFGAPRVAAAGLLVVGIGLMLYAG